MGSSQSKVDEPTVAQVSEKTAYLSISSSSPTPQAPAHSGPPPSAELSPSLLSAWEKDFAKDPKNVLSQTILSHTDIPTALLSRATQIKDAHVYNLNLTHSPSVVTNQMSSGRCWLFATTNVARLNVTKALKLKDDFELSQSYLFFYDKLEKAGYYLENSIELADEPLSSRVVSYLSQAPINDGGQQDMAAGLIEKYGLIPKALYPESYSSSNSGKLNTLLTSYLRQSALGLRKMIAAGKSIDDVRRQKEVYMEHVYKVLAITLGTPPSPSAPFTFDYYDKDGKYGKVVSTPLDFAKKYAAGAYPFTEMFSLIHDPRNKTSKAYTVDRLGNIWGGRKVVYVNTEIERLSKAVVKSLKNQQAVWFGCDVGAFSSRGGEMDLDIYDYKTALDLDFTLTKAERLELGDSAMTHAMVITAVHLDDDGKPVRYRVENSWSDAAGQKGFMVMSQAWFEQFVYQVVIHKSLADVDLVEVLKQEPVVLPAYDPLGALA